MKEELYLEEIPRVQNISKEDFVTRYVKPQKPVVIERLIEDWPAFDKWSLDYIQEIAGDKTVPLFDNRPISSKYKFNEPHLEMKMADYIDLLKSEPTKYRIFLYHILKEVPSLQKDFQFPKIGLKILKQLPMLFLEVRIPRFLCITTLILQIFFTFIFTEKNNVSFFPHLKVSIYIRFLTP